MNTSYYRRLAHNVLTAILPEFLPTQAKLLANDFNPFSPATQVPFQLRDDASLTANIYDAAGRQIRILELGHFPVRIHIVLERNIVFFSSVFSACCENWTKTPLSQY